MKHLALILLLVIVGCGGEDTEVVCPDGGVIVTGIGFGQGGDPYPAEWCELDGEHHGYYRDWYHHDREDQRYDGAYWHNYPCGDWWHQDCPPFGDPVLSHMRYIPCPW